MKLIKEVTKFLITGGISAIITLIVMNVLLLLQNPLFISSTIGYGSGMLSSFFLNKKWTFSLNNKSTCSEKTFILFVSFNVLMMIIFGYINLGFSALTESAFAGQILSILSTTIINFLVYKILIFKK